MGLRPRNSVIIKKNLPCKFCDSSDATIQRADNSYYCFSCAKNSPNKQLKEDVMIEQYNELGAFNQQYQHEKFQTVDSVKDYKSYGISSRCISKEVVDHFEVKMQTSQDGQPEAHMYPYTRDGKLVAYKKRLLPKSFTVIGNFNNDLDLFGQKQSESGKYLVITEGEIDCMSVAQANLDSIHDRIFPVVSVPSASAKSVITKHREWMNSFERVILMMDNDDAGQVLQDFICRSLKVGKVFIAKHNEKDANDLLVKKGSDAVMQAIWNAREYTPAGIIKGEQIWEQYEKRRQVKSIPYPPCLNGVNEKIGGLRLGEITTFTSGTGAGKSTVIKEIILHILKNEDAKVGLISLEESVGDTTEKFISMALKRNLSENESTDEERRAAFEEVFSNERLILLDHQGSVGDSSLIDNMEHLCAMGCKYLVLDHITIAVSEGNDGLTGNAAIDKMMSDLLKVVKRQDVWLGVISHLRKAPVGGKSFEDGHMPSIDDMKGSGALKQISFDVIAFSRNTTAEDEVERNTTHFRVLKSRFTGRTGNAGAAMYDPKTCRLTVAAVTVFDELENDKQTTTVDGFLNIDDK